MPPAEPPAAHNPNPFKLGIEVLGSMLSISPRILQWTFNHSQGNGLAMISFPDSISVSSSFVENQPPQQFEANRYTRVLPRFCITIAKALNMTQRPGYRTAEVPFFKHGAPGAVLVGAGHWPCCTTTAREPLAPIEFHSPAPPQSIAVGCRESANWSPPINDHRYSDSLEPTL